MKKFAAALLISGLWIFCALAPARGAGIGLVAGIRGDATVRHDRAAQSQQLKFKDDLFWQDTLSTGTDAQLRLLILQKSVITMKELTQLQLREELVSPNQPKKKSVVELVSGAVRVAVDKNALKDSDYEVHTNMAVAAIRGSDLFGQKTSDDRVQFCTGPDSTVTAIHRDPGVGRRELHNLQCAEVSPGGIAVKDITLDLYRTLTSIGPSGSQNPNNPGSGNANVNNPPPPPPPGGGAGGGSHGGSTSNPYTITNGGLLSNTKGGQSGPPE
jgi:hypothetical protein